MTITSQFVWAVSVWSINPMRVLYPPPHENSSRRMFHVKQFRVK
jgi:hypothetical protein